MKYLPAIWTGLLIYSQFLYCSEIYQSIRVFNPSPNVLRQLAESGIPLDQTIWKPGKYIDIIVSEHQSSSLLDGEIEFKILISDLSKYVNSRNVPTVSRNFPLGSMQGNYTWDELNNRFDELQNLYGSIISDRFIIGESVEGRDIWAFKVSDNPDENEQEPEVLYTGLTHSREPMSMMNLFYFVQVLGENYGFDSELTYLVNNREMWFIPVVNPDGYVYNENYAPDGGGMHRKNRFNTNCGDGTERGVDLNRNFSFGWGDNNSGSSAASDVYKRQ